MPLFSRRRSPLSLILGGAILLYLIYLWSEHGRTPGVGPVTFEGPLIDPDYLWSKVPIHYPAHSIRSLPSTSPVRYPAVQAKFPRESLADKEVREERQQVVKRTFEKCWKAYKSKALGADELAPVTGGRRNPFGGWAATLVDSLDTLWIMGMKTEFESAVVAVEAINFTHTELKQVNVFETNIRYLGGFLSAFDLSRDVRLLRKAAEVGEMLYKAFDTPNRMPITRWDFHAAAQGEKQTAPSGVLIAEIGSLSMEFTRLSMVTGDPKWFDAIQRITDEMAAQQGQSALPGLWPLKANAESKDFRSGGTFTLGAMADSAYEYLPKMMAMMGGQLPVYKTMYEKAMDTAIQTNLFRPLTPTNEDILISGQIHIKSDGGKPMLELEAQGQHLVCFLGGLMALGGKLFGRKKDLEAATKLVDGCIWTYKNMQHGIMPEVFHMTPCLPNSKCEWDEKAWKQEVLRRAGKSSGDSQTAQEIIGKDRLPEGFTSIDDRRYILRPEAIESVFVLYRVTARTDLVESAWAMFTAIEEVTRTELAYSAVRDITSNKPEATDSMESFWMGETLKYFYLIFSEPGLISLDEFVFNTEAHPFRRLVR